MTTIASLTTPMTVAEAEAAIYAALSARGARAAMWKPGIVIRTIVYAVAVIASAFSILGTLITRSGFLELASGPWLTVHARGLYYLERVPRTYATGSVTLSNAGGNVFVLDPGELILGSSASGETYRNTEPVTINAHASGLVVPVRAAEPGAASSVAANEIDSLVTTLSGVAITSSTSMVGTDEESDAALRFRCANRIGSRSPNGPTDAYFFALLSATSTAGAPLGINRIASSAPGNGIVSLVIATASGAVPGDVNDPGTDLGAAKVAIDAVTPIGVSTALSSATPVTIDVTAEVWVRESIGMSDAEIEDAVQAGLDTAIGSFPIGGDVVLPASGKLYVDTIKAEVTNALPAGSVVRIVVTTPAADVAIAPGEVAVPGVIALSAVHRVGA